MPVRARLTPIQHLRYFGSQGFLETPHQMPGKSWIRAGAVGDMRQKWPFLGREMGDFERGGAGLSNGRP